eukprot:4070700-Amphidinium_carterae.2
MLLWAISTSLSWGNASLDAVNGRLQPVKPVEAQAYQSATRVSNFSSPSISNPCINLQQPAYAKKSNQPLQLKISKRQTTTCDVLNSLNLQLNHRIMS